MKVFSAQTHRSREVSCHAGSVGEFSIKQKPAAPRQTLAKHTAIDRCTKYDESLVSRRSALMTAGFGSLLLVVPSSANADDLPSIYQDPKDGFSIAVPNGWTQGSGELGSKPQNKYSNAAGLQRVIAWYPAAQPDVNLAITIRTPAADFTSLGSFGTAQDFGENIVTQMDSSYLLRGNIKPRSASVVVATLIDAKEDQGRYIIRYTTSKDGQPTRSIISAVALGTSPSGLRRFFTVNGSWIQEEENTYSDVLIKAVESFVPPALTY